MFCRVQSSRPKVDQSLPKSTKKAPQDDPDDPKSSLSLAFSSKCRMSGLYCKTQYETMFFKFRLDKKVGQGGLFFYFFVLFFGRRVWLVFFGLW